MYSAVIGFFLFSTIRIHQSDGPGQKYTHCLTNILNFACQTCLFVSLAREPLPDKHIVPVNDSETVKNCLSVWPSHKHVSLVTNKKIQERY